MFPLLKNCIDNWLFPRSSYLMAFVGVLCMVYQIGQVSSVDDGSMNKTCTPCLTPNCADQSNCVQQCLNSCPPNYYQKTQNISFVCETSQQTSVPTTKMTTAEKTTQSSTMPTTTVIPTTTETLATPMPPTPPPPTYPTEAHPISAAEPNASQSPANRRRRQVPEASTAMIQNEQTTQQPVTIGPPIIKEPTTTQPPIVITQPPIVVTIQSSTTSSFKIICKKCSIANCKTCADDAHQNTVCSACADGYSVSSDKGKCNEESKGLNGGAIAGIVIGVLCAVIIVVVVIVYFVLRRRSQNISSDESEKIQHQRKTSEELEIDQLDDAPAPPTEDQSQRYDRLQTSKVDEKESYSPFGSVSESPYVNQPRKHQIRGSYVNTQNNIDSAKNSPPKTEEIYNNDPKNDSSDPAGYYEPVNPQRYVALNSDLVHKNLGFGDEDTKSNAGDTQGVYANFESIKTSQGNTNKKV